MFKQFLLILAMISLWGDFCYFIPPEGWDLADPDKLSPRVKVCFLGKSSGALLPSVNLATEVVDVGLKEYVAAVKKMYETDPNIRWRDLGKYTTPFGEGRLTEVEANSEWGKARQVQLLAIKNNTAYILTAGSLREEFSKHYKVFDKVLKSLRVVEKLADLLKPEKRAHLLELIEKAQFDLEKGRPQTFSWNIGLSPPESLPLIEVIKTPYLISFIKKQMHQLSKEEAFEQDTFKKETWQRLQEKIITDFTEMGPYWQILMLQEIQNQLIRSSV